MLAVFPDRVLQLFLLLVVEHVAALALQLFEHLVIDRVEQDYRIVRRARSRIVERLGNANLLCREVEIGGVVHGDDRIANAHAQRGRTRGVSGGDHGRAASGEHAVTLAHQLVGLFDRGHVYRLH